MSNNRPTGYQCMQYTAKELIERWGKFHADITVSPLPRHKYTVEAFAADGKVVSTLRFKQLSSLLHFSFNAKQVVPFADYLVISRDGNFFTAKEV